MLFLRGYKTDIHGLHFCMESSDLYGRTIKIRIYDNSIKRYLSIIFNYFLGKYQREMKMNENSFFLFHRTLIFVYNCTVMLTEQEAPGLQKCS